MTQKLSEMVVARLREGALHLSRPDVRLATINRLVMACNAIDSGIAAELVKTVTGKEDSLRLNPKINPSNVEKYVRARRKSDKAWTGPTRVTIQKDPDLLSYVEAREAERTKPVLPKRPTSRRRQIEDTISLLPTIEARMDIRHELEGGREAQRVLNLLKIGLRKIPHVDVDALINEPKKGQIEAGRFNTSAPLAPPSTVLQTEDRNALRALVRRLSDAEELGRAGLELVNERIRNKISLQALVKPAELAVLRRLAEIPK